MTDDVVLPEGFEKVEAAVYRKGRELLVVGVLAPEGPFAFRVQLGEAPEAGEAPADAPEPEDPGPPPDGYEWTGEVRPPRKGEYFWSEIRGRVVQAIKDETGVNQFGEPTGGRRILRPASAPARPRLRLVKDDDEG